MPIPYRKFLRDLGLSPTTGWRLRRRGLLNAFAIAGKLYVSRKDAISFLSHEANSFNLDAATTRREVPMRSRENPALVTTAISDKLAEKTDSTSEKTPTENAAIWRLLEEAAEDWFASLVAARKEKATDA